MNEHGPPLGLVILLRVAMQGKDGGGILGDSMIRPRGEVVLGNTMRVL